MNRNKTTKSQGQRDYEANVKARPLYHTGKPRKTWDQLDAISRWPWERGEYKPPEET